MDERLLAILCCPTTRQPVRVVRADELAQLNAAIAITHPSGADSVVAAPLREALITLDGRTIYRIDDGIPVMLAEEAIDATRLRGFPEPVAGQM